MIRKICVILITILNLISTVSYAETAQVNVYLRKGAIQRHNSQGARIVVLCADKICSSLRFAEIEGSKLTILNKKNLNQAEFELAIESLLKGIYDEEPKAFYFTHKLWASEAKKKPCEVVVKNDVCDLRIGAVLSGILMDMPFIQLEMSWEIISNLYHTKLIATKKNIREAYQGSEKNIINAASYDEMKAMIQEANFNL